MKPSKSFLANSISRGKGTVGRWLALGLLALASGSAAHAQGAQVRINPNTVQISEGASGTTNTATLRVSLDRASSVEVNVTFSTQDGTGARPALSGQDFTGTTGTLTFLPGELGPKAINVPVLGDDAFEGNETFTVVLTAASGATIASGGGTGTVTILDDDTLPSFSVSNVIVNEPPPGTTTGGLVYTVNLSNPSGRTIALSYATDDNNINNTAIPNVDYISATGTISFAPGELQKTIPIQIRGDSTVEVDPVVILRVTPLDGTQEVGPSAVLAEGTIINDDRPSISIGDVPDSLEGSVDFVRFPVSLSTVCPFPVTVSIRTRVGTAGTDDFVSVDNAFFTFIPGQKDLTFDVALKDDNIKEGTEFFTAEIYASSDADILQASATCRIIDNDQVPVIAFNNPRVDEGTGTARTAVTFTATLIGSSTEPVSFEYQTADGSATLANSDYVFKRGVITFPGTRNIPASGSQSIDIEVLQDATDESDETFSLLLSNPQNGSFEVRPQAPFAPTATIVNDDGPVISFNPANPTVSEGNTGTQTVLKFIVVMAPVSPNVISVDFSTSDGTARAGEDYVTNGGTLTFQPGESQKSVNVVVNGDNIFEPAETLNLTLSNPVGGTFPGKVTTFVDSGTITNDDAFPNLSINDVTRFEGNAGATQLRFTVTLSNPTSQTVTVSYQTVDGTATIADNDYQSVTGQLIFQPGDTQKFIDIFGNGDGKSELSETFTVRLSAPVNAGLARANGLGTLTDDDGLPVVSITSRVERLEVASTPPAPGTPGATVSGFQFNVNLDRPSGVPVTVLVSVTDDTATRISIPGTPGTPDYKLPDTMGSTPSQLLTFAPGDTSLIFPRPTVTTAPGPPPVTTTVQKFIEIVDDTVDENIEQFRVTLANPSGATLSPTLSQGVGVILDNDAGGTISIVNAEKELEPLTNGGVSADFEVKLSTPAGKPVAFNYTVEALGTAGLAGPGDVNTAGGTVAFPAGTISLRLLIPIKTDQISEDDETFKVKITSLTPEWTTAADAFATCVIEDDDPSIHSVTPISGNGPFFGFNATGPATKVVVTGKNFDRRSPTSVRFPRKGGGRITVPATDTNIISNTQMDFLVPAQGTSGTLQIGNPARVADTVNFQDPGKRNFYVLPTITGSSQALVPFSPTTGVQGVTRVTVQGFNFADPLAGASSILFNGVAASILPGKTDTQAVVILPGGATTGKLKASGLKGAGPDSLDIFNVPSVTPGGIEFVRPLAIGSIIENSQSEYFPNTNTYGEAVGTFQIQLKPALQPGLIPVPARGSVTVRLTATSNKGTDPLRKDPTIRLRSGFATRLVGLAPNSIDFSIPAGTNSLDPVTIAIVDSGDDNEIGDATLTMSMRILTSGDPQFYPVSGATAADTFTINRVDTHGFVLDTSTVLRTNENASAADATKEVQIRLANTRFRNLNGTLNTDSAIKHPDKTRFNRDSEPKADVLVNARSTDITEGLVSYVVYDFDNDGTGPDVARGRLERQAIPQEQVKIIFASDPTSDDYFMNPHFVKATGVDDLLQDGAQTYRINLTTDFSNDPEFGLLPLNANIVLVNTDNEQVPSTDQPGYFFGPSADGTPPTLTVNEGGLGADFTIRLRKAPQIRSGNNLVNGGKVTLWLRSSDITQVRLIDPRTNTQVENFPVVFYGLAQGSYQRNETRWDVPIAIRVVGIADGVADGVQNVSIITNPGPLATDDEIYKQINPADVPVIARDEVSGYLVQPSAFSVTPNATGNFQVSLRSQPTTNVVLNFSSRNIAEVRFNVAGTLQTTTSLTFTPANFATPQTVTVAATADSGGGAVVVQIVSTVTTSDPTYTAASTPTITVTKANTGTDPGTDPGTGTGVGPTTFAANTKYGISFPLFYTNRATTINNVFNRTQSAGGFKVFKFRNAGQTGTLLPAGSPSVTPGTGQPPSADYVEIGPNESLERGRGYLLITGGSALSFKTTAADSGLRPLATTSTSTYSISLLKNVTATAPTDGGVNGLNLIGFPFNTSTVTQASFENVQVRANGVTYNSLLEAVAAGIMSSALYTVNGQGKLTQITASNRFIKANNAYYVQVYANNVTLILRQPS